MGPHHRLRRDRRRARHRCRRRATRSSPGRSHRPTWPARRTPLADEDGHGSPRRGLACAATDDGIGVAGAGFGCRLAVVKLGSTITGGIRDEDIADGIRIATDRGADAINMSFGGGATNAVLRQVIDYAVSRGVVLVAAASNDPVEDQGAPAVGAAARRRAEPRRGPRPGGHRGGVRRHARGHRLRQPDLARRLRLLRRRHARAARADLHLPAQRHAARGRAPAHRLRLPRARSPTATTTPTSRAPRWRRRRSPAWPR